MSRGARHSLRDAYRALLGDLDLVLASFGVADQSAACIDPHRNNREWCVLYLNDAWHRFCRTVVIGSAIYQPLTLSGSVVPRVAGLSNEDDVLTRLRTMPGPKKAR